VNFWSCSTGAAWTWACSYEAEFVVSAWSSFSALWGICPAVAEGDLARKVVCTWRADCMASSAAGCNSDGYFSCGDTWRSTFTQFFPGLSKIFWHYLKQLWQRSVPTCYGVFERLLCAGALPSALKWTEAASNACCNYEAPMVWSHDSLRHLTVTFILKT
jgi:hypothetical protein